MTPRNIAFAIGVGLLISAAASGPVPAAEVRTQTNGDGPVTVAVTPITVTPGQPLRLKVVLDTHSVDLSAVSLDRVVLVRSATELVPPTRLESVEGEGHHREALLLFPASAVSADRGTLEVLVKDVGGVTERRFTWSLPLATAEAAPAAGAAAATGAGTGAVGGAGTMGGGQMMGGQMMGGQMMGGQMMGVMRDMGPLMQQMGSRLVAGQLTPEQSKAIGDLMQQMGGMMAAMGGMGGQGMRDGGAMPDMSKMMERMAEMQKRMNEMEGGMASPRAMPSPR